MAEAKPPMFPLPNGKPPKPPKQWAALGGLTFEQYRALPHAEQMLVDAANAVGLAYEKCPDLEFGKPYWKGKRLKS